MNASTTGAEPTRIGIIGCGNISGIYLQSGTTFDSLEIVACADDQLAIKLLLTAGNPSGIVALVHAEFGPDGEVIRNQQCLIEPQVLPTHEIKHARAT